METAPPKSEPARVLVIEDEPDVAALIAYSLAGAGYRIRTAEDGREALRSVAWERPDLIVLDLMLPGASGYEVLAGLKGADGAAAVPVIVLTARRDEADRVRGFELGADDYVTKPFSPRELALRVAAVLRRTQAPPLVGAARVLRAGPIAADLGSLRVTVHGRAIGLTRTEFRLLTALLERRGRPQSRRALLETVWDVHVPIETRTVDIHIRRLRAKLGAAAGWIETVRGFGYRVRAATERD